MTEQRPGEAKPEDLPDEGPVVPEVTTGPGDGTDEPADFKPEQPGEDDEG